MLDFSKSCEWLHDQVGTIRIHGLEFKVSVNDLPPKRGIAVEAAGLNVAAGLYLWETGESDMDVMVDSKLVVSEWGMSVDDDTLPLLFGRFLNEVKRHA